MEIDKKAMKTRTKRFGLRMMRLVNELPNTAAGRAIGNQAIRCGTSAGANYRAACRARSTKEFIAKIGTVEEEADESSWWLELVIEGNLLPADAVQALLDEANELTAIFSATCRTAKRNQAKTKNFAKKSSKSEIENSP